MLTVGKVYGGILIHDNWKKTKFGQIEVLRQMEAELEAMERAAEEEDRKKRREEAVARGDDMEEWDRREAEEMAAREAERLAEEGGEKKPEDQVEAAEKKDVIPEGNGMGEMLPEEEYYKDEMGAGDYYPANEMMQDQQQQQGIPGRGRIRGG